MQERAATAMPAAMAGGGEMGELIRAHDWASTGLGPVETWPQSLLSALSILLSAQSPTFIGWGESLVQLYNDAYRPILGSTKHPASLGQTCQACFPEIWDVVGPMLSRVMATGEPTWREDELLCLERHGYLEESYFTFSYSAVRAEDGRVGGVWVSCLETSQRVFHERRLAVLRRLAGEVSGQTVGDVCSRAVALLEDARRDLPFTLLYVVDSESGAARRIAASPGAPAGAEWIDLAGEDAWAIARVARTGASAVVTLEGSTAGAEPWPEPVRRMAIQPVLAPGDGAPAAVLVAGLSPRLPVDDAYRGFVELVAGQIGVAVATARALQLERRRAEALAELDRAKTTFFNNVSHELRTPLTLLLEPLDQLLTGPHAIADEVRDAVDLAHRNGLRLLRLVNSLLDFARLGAQHAEPHFEPTALDAFTAELASCFESAIGGAGLRLVVDCPPAADAVYVDRAMWEKIVLNLLSNALKFTFEGEIRVVLRAAGAHAELRVEDTGIGIAAHEQERIFARFHRVRGARSRSHEGTGIGLALVRDLVELHHGTIEVTSREGAGSSFVVRIPLGRGHLPPAQVHEVEQQQARPVAPRAFIEEARRWGEPAAPTPAGTGDRGHILVVDDNADMRQYLRTLLERRGWPVEVAGDGAAALAALQARPPALLLTDAMMPEMDGFELLARIRADPALRALPVAMITARAGQEAAVEGLEAGADDYIVKPFRSDELVRRVDATVRLARSREEAASYRGLVDHVVHGIGRCAGGVLITANPALAALLGYESAAAVLGVDLRARAFVDDGDAERLLGPGAAVRGEDVQLRRRDGTLLWGRISRGTVRGDVCELMIEDITERRVLEEQVRQAQKMDAIGQLTAGIAHDFNNLLTAILVNTDLSVRALRRGRTTVLDELDTVRAAGRRGADMVRKLMSFSRQRESDLRPVDVGEVVTGVAGMLQRLLPENIEIRTDLEPTGLLVQADAGALEQVLLNLATNARDAMPDGGVLSIAGSHLTLDAARCAALGWGEPGDHVLVTVRDDGSGMDDTARRRIFEPFFTTKAPGRGTGLGMAMVYAIVQQHRGSVSIDSAPGQGTAVRLLFPRLGSAELAAAPLGREPARRTASETVLVVEDDLIVRDAARAALEGAGYRVLLARDGVEAIRLLDGGGTRIDLVISDEVMPRCTGAELYAAARRMLHMPRFLFTSGYSDGASRPYPGGVPFLAKPWSDAELTGRVREVLDAGVGSFGLTAPRPSPTLQ
jgi:PAS domain S-box-containing protein